MKTLAFLRCAALPLVFLAGCGDGGDGNATSGGPEPVVIPPTTDWTRDITSTGLVLDVSAMTGEATIQLAPSASLGASFEVEGLDITKVEGPSGPLEYVIDAGRLDLGVPKSEAETEVRVSYSFKMQSNFDGYLAEGLTFLWPAFCGNLFPCKSVPSEGVRFTMDVTGVPMGKQVVFPLEIPSDAPTYMPAFATGEYTKMALGATTAGTKVVVFQLPGDEANTPVGTKDLVAVFDWYEKTYGAYTFGGEVGSVSANWGPGAYGGMEHHPYWHIARDAMNDPVTHAHEAAHGWFGDGVRISCWEDFVLSEGTVSYLAARALEAVAGPAVGQSVWDDYQTELDSVLQDQDTILMLDTCNKIDLITHPLWSNTTYMKGAFFYKAVEMAAGRDAIDKAIKAFYTKYHNKSARMQDMLDTIKSETGFDPSMLAKGWLQSLGKP